jgi:hypothetical protein
MKTLTATFQYPDGTPANGATLYLKLSQDAVALGTSQVAPRIVAITLNNLGQIPGGVTIFANDELTPSGTVYIASVIAVGGGLVYGPELLSISGTSPVNLNSLVPTNVGGIVISYPNPVLQNPSSPQTITGQSLTLSSSAPLILQGALTINSSAVFNSGASFVGALTFTNLTSASPNPALSGKISLSNTDSISWRNSTNSADASLFISGAAQVNFPADTLVYSGNGGISTGNFFGANAGLAGAATGYYRLRSTDTIVWRNNAASADIVLGKNTSDQLTWPNIFVAAGAIYTAAAPTTAAAQVSFGSTTATSASTGSNGDVPAQVVGYIIVNIGGTNMKVPYYNI